MATAPATMNYTDYIKFYKLQPTAASALAWLQSGHAPVGTPIPLSLRSHFGGAGSLQLGTPNVDWSVQQRPPTPEQVQANPLQYGATLTPAVEPTGPGTLPTPQNPYLPQLTLIGQQLANMGATYNPQRQAVAAATAANLAGSGLVDFGNTPGKPRVVQTPNGPQVTYDYTTEVGRQQNAFNPAVPDITYGVVQGADGRSYLQAYSGTQHNFASRGVGSGSQVDVAQRDARQGLDLQRQQAYSAMQNQQANITGQEQGQVGTLASNWADYMGKGAQEAANTVAGWSVAPSTPGQAPQWSLPTTPSPLTQMTGGQRTVTGAAGTKAPSVSYKTFVGTHGGTSTPALSAAWKKRFGVTTKPASLGG